MTRLYLDAGVSTPKSRAPISNNLLVIDFWRLCPAITIKCSWKKNLISKICINLNMTHAQYIVCHSNFISIYYYLLTIYYYLLTIYYYLLTIYYLLLSTYYLLLFTYYLLLFTYYLLLFTYYLLLSTYYYNFINSALYHESTW